MTAQAQSTTTVVRIKTDLKIIALYEFPQIPQNDLTMRL